MVFVVLAFEIIFHKFHSNIIFHCIHVDRRQKQKLPVLIRTLHKMIPMKMVHNEVCASSRAAHSLSFFMFNGIFQKLSTGRRLEPTISPKMLKLKMNDLHVCEKNGIYMVVAADFKFCFLFLVAETVRERRWKSPGFIPAESHCLCFFPP